MGEQNVQRRSDEAEMRAFMKALLNETQALELMLENSMFETDVRRIGAEQEMFLVDKARLPSRCALELLDELGDERFTHEIALFNLEANLSPQVLGGDCLSRMEAEANEVYEMACHKASAMSKDIVLVGILPTLNRSYLGLDNMVPVPRYKALNDALVRLRGSQFNLSLQGKDQLDFKHDNVMLEACNTSFQVHFQVAPDEFANLYNIAQAVTGPLMAAAVNSPMLLGKRLWHETRIAVFEHSIDARSDVHQARGLAPRVHFGDSWVNESVLEIFKEDIARFRVILTTDYEEDPIGLVQEGKVPKLNALRLHNGTVYRWNRACYGPTGDVPHLRIENRVLPSGPSVLDEVANAAFFFGLMSGVAAEVDDIREVMAFDDAKTNFFAAAREGLKAQFTWFGGEQAPAADLILSTLVPLARKGLNVSGINDADIDRYMGVIEARVGSKRTGAKWLLDSLKEMGTQGTLEERLRNVTSGAIDYQQRGLPVHEWPLAEFCPSQDWRDSYRTVGQFMTTDLFTVRPDDLIDFAASLMEWKHLRQVPVEDDFGDLVGLVGHRDLLRMIARGTRKGEDAASVRDLMKPNPISVEPSFPTVDAIRLMREQKVSSLPVVEGGKLVGIITEADLLGVASKVLEKMLSED